ncbi:NADH:ubiquinone oxidoreductase subunit 5 (subunit L)/multisubunit Na+/H+ antiporter MnhA subunit [Sporosarcina luteola]|nr:NADH:ubiquinone oxidoreductase subunit 5 (subunit L)/multisubunit Na+/H+ antiporter MnhA subunit [Sporosarcina luteola]
MYHLPKGLFEDLLRPIKNGFFITTLIMICVLVFIMLKRSKYPYLWIIIHFVLLSLSGYIFFDALNPKLNTETPQSIVYYEIHMRFIITGIIWIMSLICLLVGIRRIPK